MLTVGLVSPLPHKGFRFWKKLVEYNRSISFISIGNIKKGIKCDNYYHYHYDEISMKEFYAKIDVLLILSIVPETFCRVIVEAAMSEVRCLAYSKGNIPL